MEYVKCGNGAEAARRAGYACKYADHQAYENLRKPQITRFIEGLGAEADVLQGLTIEHVAAMLLTQVMQGKNENACIRAIELLGKWKGMFTDRVTPWLPV